LKILKKFLSNSAEVFWGSHPARRWLFSFHPLLLGGRKERVRKRNMSTTNVLLIPTLFSTAPCDFPPKDVLARPPQKLHPDNLSIEHAATP